MQWFCKYNNSDIEPFVFLTPQKSVIRNYTAIGKCSDFKTTSVPASNYLSFQPYYKNVMWQYFESVNCSDSKKYIDCNLEFFEFSTFRRSVIWDCFAFAKCRDFRNTTVLTSKLLSFWRSKKVIYDTVLWSTNAAVRKMQPNPVDNFLWSDRFCVLIYYKIQSIYLWRC